MTSGTLAEHSTDPSKLWNRLDWDSEFFGFPIGSVELKDLDDDAFEAVEADARAAGIVCLYGGVDSSYVDQLVRAQRHGYQLVNSAILFDFDDSGPPIHQPEGVTVRVGRPDDVDELEPLALKMASWSRYAVDPRFGIEHAERLQRAWLQRAARADDGVHSLLVAEEDGEIVAFIGRVDGPEPRIDAVATAKRGSGAARYLMEIARGWAGDRRLVAGPIAARNINSLRYVSHCHYYVCEVRWIFHRWLDQASHDEVAPRIESSAR